MPSPSAASEIEKGKENILSILQGELDGPTQEPATPSGSEPEEGVTVDTTPDVETLQSDTETSRIVKIPVDGREVDLQILSDDVDPESLRLGWLAEADYRKKSMALADLRKNAESRMSELDSALSETKSRIEVDLASLENDTELRESDPDEYLRRLDDVQTRAKQYQAHMEQLNEARQAELQMTAEKEQEMLSNALPGWLDAQVRNQDIERIGNQLSSLGFSQEEMGSLVDHRIFLLARKAALFDEITSKDLSEKRDRTPPKNARPGTASTTSENLTQWEQEVRDRLKKSGKVGHAAALFKGILTKGR